MGVETCWTVLGIYQDHEYRNKMVPAAAVGIISSARSQPLPEGGEARVGRGPLQS